MNWLQVASLFTGSANAGAVARRVGLLLAGLGLAWTLLAGGVGVAMWGLVVLLSQWMPTAVAVTSDLIEVARDIVGSEGSGGRSGLPLRLHIRDWRDRPIRPAGELSSRYYLRFTVIDRPGVLARIAGVLGENHISISQVVQQDEAREGEPVTLVVTTHRALEKDVQAALAAFAGVPECVQRTRLLRILDGNA